MKKDLIDINEAASICGKSLQTIRRAIKSKKIHARRLKTPQGFNYLLDKKSVMHFFGAQKSNSLKEIPVENLDNSSGEKKVSEESPLAKTEEKIDQIKELKNALQSIVGQYNKEREQMSIVFKELQNRLMIMENQVRLLSAPKKRWYKFWA